MAKGCEVKNFLILSHHSPPGSALWGDGTKKHPDGRCGGSPSPRQASGLTAAAPHSTQHLSPYTLFIFHNSLQLH